MRQNRTAKGCHPSQFFIHQAFEIYMAIGAPARAAEGCDM